MKPARPTVKRPAARTSAIRRRGAEAGAPLVVDSPLNSSRLAGDDGLALGQTVEDFDVGLGRDAGVDFDVPASAVRADDLDETPAAEPLDGYRRHNQGVVLLP